MSAVIRKHNSRIPLFVLDRLNSALSLVLLGAKATLGAMSIVTSRQIQLDVSSRKNLLTRAIDFKSSGLVVATQPTTRHMISYGKCLVNGFGCDGMKI